MEALVLNSDFEVTGVVDAFTSFIWTERYSSQGDFELQIPISSGALSFINTDSYLHLPGSDRLMFIETVKIAWDSETGTNVLVSGRSLESVLDRRIVWGFFASSGNLQGIVQQVLNGELLNPTNTARKLSRLAFITSTDPLVTSLTANVQLWGNNVYDVVEDLCESADIGFRITMPTLGSWRFGLYAGVDRSYAQLVNPYVVFSPGFENLLSSTYVTSKKLLKTVTFIGGEGAGSSKRWAAVAQPGGSLTELARRGMYTDASGVSSNGGAIPNADYIAQLEQKGRENLANQLELSMFDGEAQVGDMYEYGRDYYLGDIVQITNEHGFSSRSRVVEFIRAEDETGIKAYPTLTAV